MILLRILPSLWFLAVSFAAATKNVHFSEKHKAYPKKVKMKPFYHTPNAGFPSEAESYDIWKQNKFLEVAGIDNAAINKIWTLPRIRQVKGQPLIGKYIPNSVYFLAYFRFPTKQASFDSEAFEKTYLIVRHKPGLAFKWYPELTRIDYFFEHVETSQIDRNTCTSVYKVLGRLGSVILLRLMILGVKRNMVFSTEWAKTWDLGALEPLALQLVRVKPGRESLLPGRGMFSILPYEQKPAAGTSTLVPLYAPMPDTALKSIASKIDSKSGKFQINGHFKVPKEPHTYFLSSTVPVEVRIYTNFHFYTLVAYEGRASSVTLNLNPEKLHNIKIKGKLNDGGVAGFTLQVFREGGILKSSYVKLAALSGEEMWPDAFTGERPEYYNIEPSDDYESEQPADSGIESSYNQESENHTIKKMK